MRSARAHRMEDQGIRFLTGLNDNFNVINSQVLLLDPLHSINKVYSLVVQEESNNCTLSLPSISEDSSILVNATDSKKQYGHGKSFVGSKNNSKFCTFCKRTNHTVEFCYQKHGYPNSYKSISSANATNASSSGTTDIQPVNSAIDNPPLTGLTQEHYNHLVSLLQQSQLLASGTTSSPPTSNHITSATSFSSSSVPHTHTPTPPSGISIIFSCALSDSSHDWLLDSGANEHICSSLHYFTSYHPIKPVLVHLPNKTIVTMHHAGTVVFSPHFHITNVLYSPHFKVNLISIAKIISSLNCYVKFLPDKCIIQDLITNKMIGLVDPYGGLYKLRISPSAFDFNSSVSNVPHYNISINKDSQAFVPSSFTHIPDSALWHFRLGHLFNQRLSNMHSLYPSICVDNKAICDVCQFAKHKKLPFFTSSCHASSKFELLHCDIWGPLNVPSIHGHKYFITIVDDYSRFVWIILIKSKAEVSLHIQQFITLIEN